MLLAGSVYLALWMATFAAASMLDFFGSDVASPCFPPAGLRFFLLLAFGWAGVLLEWLALVVHDMLPWLSDAGGGPFRFWDLQRMFSLFACAAVILPLRRWVPEIRNFAMPGHFALFFSAALLVSALGALGAAPASLDQVPVAFLSRLIGEFIAIITLVPLLLVWVLPGLDQYLRQGHWRERRAGHVESARSYSACLIDSLLLGAALLGAALLGWVGMSWGFDLEQYFPFAPLFLLLPLAGVALRGGLRGAVLGTAVLEGGLVLWVALRGDLNGVLEYQMSMIAVALTGLLLGGAMEARNQALGRLRGYNDTLQRELVTTEQHLQVLLRAAPVGILEFDANERCCYISAIGCNLCGCTLEQALGRNVLEFVHPNDRDYFGFVWQINRHSEETQWLEFRLNGTDLWCAAHWVNRRGADRSLEGAILVLANATERREKDERLWLLAHCDTLTGLPNRALYWDRLEQELLRAKRMVRSVAVLWVDLDGFKAVNDRLGHAAGDALLQAVGQRLDQRLRDSDTVARVGGDEFALILSDIADPAAATSVAAKLVASLVEPFDLPQGLARISASIGMACYPQHATEAETLVQYADMAMYAAKRAGKNQVCVWPVETMPEPEVVAADRSEALHSPPAVAWGKQDAGEKVLFEPPLGGALREDG
ncbi:MAG: diguanylate cyclase [Candidatus Competibacteraceae bacterium]|nr:MAG: diguanylate cyclase [Candidatus Competibacteraceae bacterium]